MNGRPVMMAALWLAAALAGEAAEMLSIASAEPAPELDGLFAGTNGWIGADGDYSVAITPERTLWFFSDTWLGQVAGGHRTNAAMINNSVGVQTGLATTSHAEFFWGETNSKPTAFFPAADGHGWVWPMGGVYVAGRLYVVLWQMERAKGPAAFAFRHVAVWLGEVANPLEEPPKWRVIQQKVPFAEGSKSRRLMFGSAVLRQGEFVYVYGVEEKGRGSSRGLVVARVDADAMGNFGRWRFWADGKWQERCETVTPLASGMATEFSVTFCPKLKEFVAVTHDTFLSPKIVARTAPNPWGPWSDPVTVYSCPEVTWGKDIFCYAGKAHLEMSSGDDLVITYSANSTQFVKVLRDARLYWPRFVRVKLNP